MEEEIKLAEQIIEIVRRNICRKYPELMMFVPVFEWRAVEGSIMLETDGDTIFYSPGEIINAYMQRHLETVEERFLHMIAHGILGHFEKRKRSQESEGLDLAMDYQADTFVKTITSTNQNDEQVLLTDDEENLLAQLRGQNITQLYNSLRLNEQIYSLIERIQKRSDDHKLWMQDCNLIFVFVESEDEGDESTKSDAAGKWQEVRKKLGIGEGEGFEEQIAAKLCGGKHASIGAGSDEKKIKAAKGEPQNYTNVLRRFFRERECLSENEEQIDKMIYCYGLDLYENVALVEPEECTIKRILSSIVIAIDTSGSCEGNIASKFLRETKAILNDASRTTGFKKIYLLQCDTKIQKEEVFSSVDEFSSDSTFYGFGGTDFCPVFNRINEIRSEGESVEGLIYLSDGFGNFPETRPDYPVIFAMPKDESNNDLPEWVEKAEI